MSNAFFGINIREMKSESGFSLAMASQPLTTDQQGRTTIIMTYVSSDHMTQIRESVKEKVFLNVQNGGGGFKSFIF